MSWRCIVAAGRWPVIVAAAAFGTVACSDAGLRLPAAPTNVFAFPSDGRIAVTWTLGDDGGLPIENHAYSLDDGSTWNPFDPPAPNGYGAIEGLVNGVVHTLRLRAITEAGVGPASAAVQAVAAVRSYAQVVASPIAVSISDVVGLVDGSVVVVGSASGAATFGNLAPLPLTSGVRAFVARIDADGRWAWVRTLESDTYVSLYGVAAVGDTAVVTGEFRGALDVDGHGSLSEPRESLVVARIDASGAWRWVSVASGGTSGGVEGSGIAADHVGGVVVATSVFGTVTFGAAGSVAATATTFTGAVARLDGDGAWTWVVGAGGSSQTFLGSVAVADDGDIVVAGSTNGADPIAGLGPVDHPIGTGVIVAGLRADGTWSWALGVGGSGGGVATTVTIAPVGTVVGGVFWSDLVFGSSAEASAVGGSDGFVAAIDGGHTWAWATQLGAHVQGRVTDLAVTGFGDLMVGGIVAGPATIGGNAVVPVGATAGIRARIFDDGSWGWAGVLDADVRIDGVALGSAAGDGIVVAGTFRVTLQAFGYARTSTTPGFSDGFVLRMGTVLF